MCELNNIFNESLSYLKNNGAVFFEIYSEESEMQTIEVNNSEILSDKLDITRGVSIRVFDGNKVSSVKLDDCNYEKIRYAISELGKRINNNFSRTIKYESIANNNEKVLFDKSSDLKLREAVLNKLLDNHCKMKDSFFNENLRSDIYFVRKKVNIYNSYNGIGRYDQNYSCIRSDYKKDTNVSIIKNSNDMKNIDSMLYMYENNREDNKNIKSCPTGRYNIILKAGAGSMFFHECCGHTLEIQNAMKKGAIFNGMLGKKIANDNVTIIDNGSINNLFGKITIDDEGNKSKKNILIKNGVLVGYLTDLINGYRFNMGPTSTTRRESYKFNPTARMTSTFLTGGKYTENEIIQDTDKGLLIESFSFGNVNPITGDFRVDISSGYYIEKGRVTDRFCGGHILANAREILFNIDKIADNLSFKDGFCFASSGRVPVSGGEPTVRILNVPVYANI